MPCTKSTLLHLRFPFSYFLLPIFMFAVSVARSFDAGRLALVFFILHFLAYPASNGFNSYYDRDEDSIGGLKYPPPVEKSLLWTSLAMDMLSVALGFLIGWQFAVCLFLYNLSSKAYSYDKIRLKKRPVISWLGIGITQGAFVFLLVCYGIGHHSFVSLLRPEFIIPAALSSFFLMASYPMTQIYQHKEDRRRGDLTISLLLGIRGTFIFTAVFFILVTAGFIWYLYSFRSPVSSIVFILFQVPVLAYFIKWLVRAWNDEKKADYTSTMRLNLISSTCMNLFFLILYWM